jgi:hypothetical protein
MKRHRLILALVSLGTVLAGVFCLHERQRAQEQIAAARIARISSEEVQRRLSAAEEDLRKLVHDRLERERAVAMAGAMKVSGEGVESKPDTAAELPPPEALRARYLNAYRASLAGRWGLLFQVLGLEPIQVAKLEELLAQREENDLLVQRTARARGVDESDPEIQALDDQLDSANKAAIKALLGSKAYNDFRQYYHDRAVLLVVSDLAGATYATNQPLSTDQARQLIRVLGDTSAHSDSGSAVKNSVDWDQAMARAQNILAPNQLTALAALQQQYRTEERLNDYTKSLSTTAPAEGSDK